MITQYSLTKMHALRYGLLKPYSRLHTNIVICILLSYDIMHYSFLFLLIGKRVLYAVKTVKFYLKLLSGWTFCSQS